MKDKAKNALKHKVEVAGKTIPTMILVGLFLVGGGSAALLTNFGTVQGTANVDQAVTVEGFNSGEYSDDALFGGPTEAVAGDIESSDRYNISNNLDTATEVQFASEVSDADSTTLEAQEEVEGVQVSHVLYAQGYGIEGAAGEYAESRDQEYDVDVELTTDRTYGDRGNYSVHFTSGETNTTDYAKVLYPVGEDFSVSGDLGISYHGEVIGDSGNPLADEAWVLDENGTLYWTPLSDEEPGTDGIQAEISPAEFYDPETVDVTAQNPFSGASTLGDFNGVEAVGIGQGWTSRGAVINHYVDDVQVEGEPVDEVKDSTFALPEESTSHRVNFKTVAHFDSAIVGGSYDVNTTITP